MLKRYVDPSQLSLTPVRGEKDWFIDSTSFTRADGSPWPVFFEKDQKGIYAPDPLKDEGLPHGLKPHIVEYRLKTYIDVPHSLDSGRDRDPNNRWSVNVSRHRGRYKITIDAVHPSVLFDLLGKLKEGDYREWLKQRRRDYRAHMERKRKQAPAGPPKCTARKPYQRPDAGKLDKLINEQLAECDSESSAS